MLPLVLTGCLQGQSPIPFSAGPATAYAVGVDDVLTVRIQDIEESSPKNLAAIRVDPRGDIRLPVLGRVHAAGLTVEQIESTVAKGLLIIMNKPEVTVAVTEFGSCPVSVLGAVRNPGVHQVSGRKTLFEVLSLAGGLSQDAGNTIVVTRRADAGPLPLTVVSRGSGGQFFVGQLKGSAVMGAKDPGANIDVLPNDVITVPKADLVYVMGAVKKRAEIPINLRSILEGSAPDVAPACKRHSVRAGQQSAECQHAGFRGSYPDGHGRRNLAALMNHDR